jgi:cell division protein FtsL
VSSPLIFCPSCGHKCRVRKESCGKKVKCLYCLESFIVTPQMIPRLRISVSYRVLFWMVLAVTIIATSTCVYLWQQNAALARRLHEIEAQRKEEPNKRLHEVETQRKEDPKKSKEPVKNWYLVTVAYFDDKGKKMTTTERVHAPGQRSAESIIQRKYPNFTRVESVLEKKE